MEFIIDNYFWFIIGAIVILMIIVGYFAEQTDFGRKPFRRKNKKSEMDAANQSDLEETTEIGNKRINDVLAEVADLAKDPENEEELNDEASDADLLGDDNLEETSEDTDEIEETAQEYTPELPSEDLEVPIDDVETDESVEPELETEAIPEEVESEPDSEEDDVWKF